MSSIEHILAFLPCETPDQWIEEALRWPELMLIDHANCEKKAASSALNMIYRYVDKHDLLLKMSKLAREELHHFEQVIGIMKKRAIVYKQLSSSRYAGGMHKAVRSHEPAKLMDSLIVGAFIEARSCERFAKLAPHLDDDLRDFYLSLLKSESRHFEDYLKLASKYSDDSIESRVVEFASIERGLIEDPDSEFRFHSGPPAC